MGPLPLGVRELSGKGGEDGGQPTTARVHITIKGFARLGHASALILPLCPLLVVLVKAGEQI